MKEIIEWVSSNVHWIFSGVGIVILGGIFALFRKKGGNGVNQTQRSGSNSTNIQAGGNVEFTQKDN